MQAKKKYLRPVLFAAGSIRFVFRMFGHRSADFPLGRRGTYREQRYRIICTTKEENQGDKWPAMSRGSTEFATRLVGSCSYMRRIDCCVPARLRGGNFETHQVTPRLQSGRWARRGTRKKIEIDGKRRTANFAFSTSGACRKAPAVSRRCGDRSFFRSSRPTRRVTVFPTSR